MSYYLDIIDTTSPLTRITAEVASGGGVELIWNGSDNKEPGIVTSQINFEMLDVTAQDAAFIAYYSGNEVKFKVQLRASVDDSILWQGFILPDQYSEPYKNGNIFVSFTATDGLGRLKGKYLLEEYYSREKSLIDIYCQILKLTGLELDLFFAPAIENNTNKNWNSIYVDTANFIDKDKKKDAYSILETLLKDTLCLCYQADNRWYIEGMNLRMLRKVTYKRYDSLSNFIETFVYDRLLKEITALTTPTITITPPYNEITVSHKKTAPGLAKTVSTETNDGWVAKTGVVGRLYPSDWMGNGDYYGRAVAPDYNVAVYNQYFFDNNAGPVYTQDNSKFISLKEKLYIAQYAKTKIELTFDIIHPIGVEGTVSTWNDVMKYEVVFNGVVLFSNFATGIGDPVEDREKLIFSTSGNCKIQIEHIFQSEGLLDIRLYRPVGRSTDNGVLGVKLSSANVSVVDFIEEQIVSDLINDEFTIDADIELEYAEDKTGISKGFRLAKLKEETDFYNEIEVYVLYGDSYEGVNYTVVSLEAANLISENRYNVYYEGERVPILDVVYNFNNTEEMAVLTIDPITSGSFFVRKYGIADVVASRDHWTKWTDAFYKIEKVSYLQTVANIYRRMFNVAHEKMDCEAKNAVKFNDIIKFNYVFMKDFVVLNCAWNLDTNKTKLTLGRAYYSDTVSENPSGENIPPIVTAADDYYLLDNISTMNLLATAYDPDGEIVSQIWTQLSGDTTAVIDNPTALHTYVTGLTGDNYEFQIQVTDNDGATAIDTIKVIRQKNYAIHWQSMGLITNDRNPRLLKQTRKLIVTPELPDGYILSLKGEFYLYASAGYCVHPNRRIPATSWYNVYKNGVLLEGKSIRTDDWKKSVTETIPFDFSYKNGNDIMITLYVAKESSDRVDYSNRFKTESIFKFQTAEIATGMGTVSGFPYYSTLKIEGDE